MYTRCLDRMSIKAVTFVLFLYHSLANTNISNIERLFKDKILATNHRYRPTLNQSEPTQVILSLIFLFLADIDEVQQSMSSNVLLTVSWMDETRLWDPADYGGVTKVHPDPLDIWRPRLFLSNSISERDMFEDDYAPLTILSSGLTRWRPGGILYTFCPMEMTHYPFDSQTCTLNFTTGENENMLQLLAESSNINLSHYDRNGEWLIDACDAESLLIDNKYYVKFILKINRISSFTVLNVVIPVNIISSLSSLTFIMPADSGERVSFSITVLMSLTVYIGEISKDLPTTSESLPLLIMYLTGLLLHSGFAILANLIVLLKYHIFEDVQKGDATFARSSHVNRKYHCPDLEAYCNPDITQSFVPNQISSLPTKNKLNNDIGHKNPSRITISKRMPRGIQLNNKTHESFRSGFKTNGLDKNNKENMFVNKGKMGLFKQAVSCVLMYVSVLDFVLFILFFGLWIIVTIIFMTLMACGSF